MICYIDISTGFAQFGNLFGFWRLTDSYRNQCKKVTIATNSPPFGGALTVDPEEGVMLETKFSMLSFNWMDEDFPLSYQFGSLSSLSDLIVLRSKMELSHTSTLLPSGINFEVDRMPLSPKKKRRVGDSSGLVELCGKSDLEDLKNLQNELSEYYHSLISEKSKAEEFRGKPIFSFLFPHNPPFFLCWSHFVASCLGTLESLSVCDST
jgi:hypothetical protein